LQTGVTTTTASNEAGLYQFPSVQPGVYRLAAALPGFQTAVYSSLTLEVSARVHEDFTLRISGVSQTIDVIADPASPLTATTPPVGGVIDGDRIRDLPVAARNALDLVDTQADVVTGHLAGSRRDLLNIGRDGVNVMDQYQNQGVNSVIYLSTDIVD